MVIDLTPEQEALILDEAKHEGKSPEEVVTETLLWLVRQREADRASIQRGLDQADSGESIDEEEMDRRFARMSGDSADSMGSRGSGKPG